MGDMADWAFDQALSQEVDEWEAAQEIKEPAQHIPQHSNGARAEATLPRCSMCKCKCADCAYGDLRGSQSCYDTRQRHHC